MYYPFVFSFKHISLRHINKKTRIMKRNLSSLLYVITCTLFITFLYSCGESYAPITLISTDGKTSVSNNDTIYIDAFTTGKEFNIKGGNGKYIINNEDRDIVSYEYNGEKLSLKPVKLGSGKISISDSEKNESRFTVTVKNQTRIFHVQDIAIDVIGGNLTQNETKIIEDNILSGAIMKVGGTIKFEYTVEDFEEGNVTIYPEKDANSMNGIFSQNEYFDSENGNKISKFTISLAGHDVFDLELTEKEERNDTCMVLRENVTDKYKGQYPKLEKATIEYILADTIEN